MDMPCPTEHREQQGDPSIRGLFFFYMEDKNSVASRLEHRAQQNSLAQQRGIIYNRQVEVGRGGGSSQGTGPRAGVGVRMNECRAV